MGSAADSYPRRYTLLRNKWRSRYKDHIHPIVTGIPHAYRKDGRGTVTVHPIDGGWSGKGSTDNILGEVILIRCVVPGIVIGDYIGVAGND